jgi:hypothetical protein
MTSKILTLAAKFRDFGQVPVDLIEKTLINF